MTKHSTREKQSHRPFSRAFDPLYKFTFSVAEAERRDDVNNEEIREAHKNYGRGDSDT